MGNVNADATELIQVVKDMQVAINSIEDTKTSIYAKYQKLGATWNDKHYKELGDVIQESIRALNGILKTLLQSEKYIALLVKNIQEYEAVNLRNANTHTDHTSLIGIVFNSISNSLSEDVKFWDSKLDQLSDKLQQIYTEKYSKFISIEKLCRPLRETVSYETTSLFRSRGLEDGILGYNDGYRSHIAVGTGHELQTTVHENLHQLSANGQNHGIITHIRGERQNVQLNEAITELLTQRTLGDEYGPDYSAYSSNRDAMAVIESVMGEDIVSQAYFRNQPQLMQQSFDNLLGAGSWNQLSEAFDDCLSDQPHTRTSGRIRRDNLINEYVLASSRNGGSVQWTNFLS